MLGIEPRLRIEITFEGLHTNVQKEIMRFPNLFYLYRLAEEFRLAMVHLCHLICEGSEFVSSTSLLS